MIRVNTCNKPILFIIALLVSLAVNSNARSQENFLSLEVSDKVAEATVRIVCNGGITTGIGSIIGISAEGRVLILTTLDVVSPNFEDAADNASLDFCDKILVMLPNIPKPITANILRQFVDFESHLALIGIHPDIPPEQVISYDKSGKVKPGQQIATLSFSVNGVYATTSREVLTANDKFLKVDLPFPIGSDGGPVLNSKGRMVGLITSSKTNKKDLHRHAIRIKVVSSVVKNWLNELSGLELTWRPKGGIFLAPWVIGSVIAGGTAATVIAISGDDGNAGFPRPPLRPEGN